MSGHGLRAVHAEWARDGWPKPARYEVHLAMARCERCAAADARERRLSRMRAAYRGRRR